MFTHSFQKPTLCLVLLFLIFGVGSPRPIFAAALDDIGSGQVLFKEAGGQQISALHLRSHADFMISGIVAHVVLKQSFKNQTQDWQEAIYVVPMAETAAVREMTMTIGDRVIRAKIKEKQEARKIYRQAKAAGKKAALIEQARPNLFRQSVANIAPGETIEIELKYVQAVEYDNEAFSFRFSMTLTPRFIPGVPGSAVNENFQVDAKGWALPTTQVPDAHLITPPMIEVTGEGIVNPISVTVSLDPGLTLKEIASPYHQVSVKRTGEVYQVELVAGVVPMDRDFVLSWQPVVGSAPKAATFRETIDGEDYVLLMILPPEQEYATPAFPRDMVFVIDTSGSMQGTSIEQARSSLRKALSRLRPEDRFNLIEFNGAWSRLYSGMQRVDPNNLRQAGEWVSRLVAGGGTNMLPALEQALITEDSERYLKHIIFITDGAVGNEAVLFEAIVQRLGNARLFPVGIGSAPNSFFMRQAAKFGRGTYTHIGNVREVEEKMDGLFRKIDSPIATDLSIAWPGQVEAYPENIPAIYKGEPLLVVARAPQLRGEIHIRGMTAEMPWHQSLSLDTKSSQLGVGTLWARKKIEALEEAETRGRDAALVKKDIIEVALTHSLISRYTSLVAVEEIVSRMPQDLLKTTAVPNALANGQVLSAMYPRTATRATMSMIVGLISILFAGVVLLMRRMVA